MALKDSNYVRIKVEPPWDSTAGLCTEHEFESVQVGRIVKEETKSAASSLSDLCCASTDVKLEAESESEEHLCGVSAAATRDGLYLKHEVKDELVVGPEEFQQPKVLAKSPASQQVAEKNSVLGRTCSVKLECIDVDLEQCIYRMGQNTYKFHLYLRNDVAKNKIKRRIRHDGDENGQPEVEITLNHRNNHIDETMYQCEYCNFTSEFKKYVRVHKNIAHVGERRHKCNHCHYACFNKYALQAHINAMHTNKSLYKCNKCSYTCTYKNRLRFHKRSHTGETPYKCELCNYSCSRKNNRHKWGHSEKPYKCEQCNYATVRKNELLKHVIAMHASDHVHRCDQCNYATVRKERFQAHKRLHSFASTSNVYSQVIKKIHTSEKSYTCDQCNYDSSREDLLEIHKNMMHAKKIAEQ